MEQQKGLSISDGLRSLADHVIRMTIRENKIEVAIVIVIEELQAPSAQETRGLRDRLGLRYIGECPISEIVVQREFFLIDVRDKKILPAIVVKVSRIHSHSGAGLAIFTVSDLGGYADLFPTLSTVIQEKKIWF